MRKGAGEIISRGHTRTHADNSADDLVGTKGAGPSGNGARRRSLSGGQLLFKGLDDLFEQIRGVE